METHSEGATERISLPSNPWCELFIAKRSTMGLPMTADIDRMYTFLRYANAVFYRDYIRGLMKAEKVKCGNILQSDVKHIKVCKRMLHAQ